VGKGTPWELPEIPLFKKALRSNAKFGLDGFKKLYNSYTLRLRHNCTYITMSDLEKLEALLPKLVHFLPDVRLRTSTSLLFKLESGLLTSVLKYNSTYVQMIADSVTESITLLTKGSEEWKNAASAEAQTLNTLSLCVLEMSKHEAGNCDSDTNYSRVLEKLFAVQSYGVLEGNARANLEAAIAGVGKIHGPKISNSSSAQEIGYKETMVMLNAKLEGQQQKTERNRGAGAILQSSLCYHGWQFPKVLLTDIDEKLLFDVEVKVKMGHDMAAELLWDCLTDFPVAALMAHPGLLHAVLDVVGSSNSLVSGVPSKCLDAVGAMNWLQELVKAAVKAYEVQLEGRLCSLSLSSAVEDKYAGTGDAAKPAASLAANMALTLHNMRIPSIRVEEDVDSLATVYGDSVVRSCAAMAKVTSPGVCPAPSLPGLAFAACAASLPLLQSSDASTLAAVASLLRGALPFVKEPSPVATTRVSAVDAAVSAGSVDRLRLQHLLNRIERIISMQQEPPSLQKIVQMGQYDNSEERCTTQWMAQGAGSATIFAAVLELLALMPPSSICSLSASPTSQPLLNMGPHTLGVVRHICTYANTLSLTVASEQAIARAWECLAHVDPSSCSALQHCQYLLSQADSLRSILARDEGVGETRMLEQLYDCLCDTVGLLDAQVADDYRQISDYGIIPATVALLVRGLRAGMGDAGVSVVISILCCNSVSCRNMLVQALQEVMSEEVAVALLTPTFLHTLVLTCVYEGDAKDSAALAKSASQLLQNLLGTAVAQGSMRSLFISAPAKWAALLSPLKVLEWGLDAPYGHVPTAVTSFAGHLEEFCARSKAGSSPHLAFDRMLSLGLFHSESAVRAQSAARIKNELERYYAGSSALSAVPASRLEVDPFFGGDRFLYLSTWEALHDAQKAFQTEASSSGGDGPSGAVKLAAIAFGEQAIPIRVAGMRQLRALLCDSNVLALAEPSWTIHMASQAAAVLGRFYVYVNQSGSTMESSDARLCNEAASLLRLLIARCSKVRSAALLLHSTESTSAGRAESAHFSMLPAIIAVLQLSPGNNEGFAAISSEIRLSCAQALSLLAISDLFSSSSAALEVQFKVQRSTAGRGAVTVPSLLATAFTLPLSADDLSQRTADFDEAFSEHNVFRKTGTRLFLGQLQCSSKDNAVSLLANATYLTEIMAATVIPCAELHASIAGVVCKSIALATSHEELRAVLSAAECLTAIMPNVSAWYGPERLDQALERLLKSTPQTQKDMLTLSGVLQFLTALVASAQDASLVALYDRVATAMLSSLFPLMQLPSGPKPVPSQVKEYQAHINRELVQGNLMLLLRALVALPSSVFSFGNRLSDHHLSSMLLEQTSQEGSSRRQAVACAIVQSLFVNHGMYGLQEAALAHVSLDSLFRTAYNDVVLSTLKTAKLLRKPDSVQGYGGLVSSLKVLASIVMSAAAFSQAAGRQIDTSTNDMNWRWLARLFYDRRAEVRLLSLEIHSHLRSMDRYFDQALEAGSEPFPLKKYLRGIAFDNTECFAVRNSALRILLDARMMYEDASLLGQVLAAVEEQLNQRSTLLCPSSLSSALAMLTKALVLPGCAMRSAECVQALKIIPLVLELVRGNSAADMQKIAFRRVGVDIVNVSVTGAREWIGRGDEEAVRAGDLPKPAYNSGWEAVWQRQFNGTGRMSLHLALCAACRFLQMIQVGQLADSFKFAQRQFPLAQGVITTFRHDTFTSAAAVSFDTGVLGQAEGRSFSALADLLSGIVLRDGAESLGGAEQATALLAAVCAAMPRLINFACTNVSAHVGAINSLLRLLCAVFEHAPAGTGMDSSFLLAGLMRVRVALADGEGSVRARADVTISLLLQRAPSLALSNELLECSMAVIARGTRTLYDATQRAMEARSAASSPAARKGAAATAAVRLELWATMLLVQNALGSVCCDREEAMGMAEKANFHKALGILVECSEVWAQVEEGANMTPAFASLYAFINASTRASKSWVPSFAQLAVTALSLCCAFCRDNLTGKRLLLTSRDMNAQEGVGGVWNSLFSLVTLATSRKINSTVRSLSLSVLASIMPCTYSVSQSFVQKSKASVKYAKDATSHALDTALQLDNGKVRAELVALLLEALGACFIAECASRDSRTFSSASNAAVLLPSRSYFGENEGSLHAAANVANKVARENRVLTDSTSMPIMLSWVWESYSGSAVVAAALVRFVGKLSAPSVLPDGINGTFSRKLCLAVATSAEALRIVTDASASGNTTVAGMAALALWSTMHASEQARANVKKLASSDIFAANLFTKENNSPYSRDQIGRARAALQMLLE